MWMFISELVTLVSLYGQWREAGIAGCDSSPARVDVWNVSDPYFGHYFQRLPLVPSSEREIYIIDI